MKKLFIEARAVGKLSIPKKLILRLPDRIGLASSVQFVNQVSDVRKMLVAAGKEVVLLKGSHSRYPGQVLGCDAPKKIDAQAVLYLGDGLFHAQGLSLNSGLPIFILNPFSNACEELHIEAINKLRQREKAALLRFLSSESIGIIISIKPGQLSMRRAEALERKFKAKKFYYLLFDTVDILQLENFPFIECFVNAACPRLGQDVLQGIQVVGLSIVEKHYRETLSGKCSFRLSF